MKKTAAQSVISYNFPDSLILKDNDKREKYSPSKKMDDNLHLGQLKLFTNELVFVLQHCYSDASEKRKQIVYIGAGPGNHLVILTRMFPTIEWHLFDVRFDPELSKIKNVKLFRRYFDEEDVKNYSSIQEKNVVDLYLISDIRNLSYDSGGWSLEEELKVMEDMELQKNWVQSIKPKFSMLKFRLPFPEKEVIAKVGESVFYLDGIIYKQPWARSKSIETRLVVPCEYKMKKWNLRQYEEQMYYHNLTIRRLKYKSVLPDFIGKEINKKLTIDEKFDSTSTIEALYLYFMRVNGEDYPIEKLLKKIELVLDKTSMYD